MYKLIFTSLLLGVSLFGVSQNNELVYSKIVRGVSNKAEMFYDSSGYVLTYYDTGSPDSPFIDFGIWGETSVNTSSNGMDFSQVVVVYNANFEVQSLVLYQYPGSLTALPISMEQTFLNFNKTAQSNTTEFVSIPPVVDYPASIFGQSVLLKYDAISETNIGTLNFSSPAVDLFFLNPYSGFFNAVFNQLPPTVYNKLATVIGDSILVTFLNLHDTQLLNDTEEFSSCGGQQNVVRVQLNLETDEVISEQIGSSTGNLATFYTESAKDGSGLFRVGLVRGNDTPISSSGAEVEMTPNDSLYHVFITKETASGQTEWLTNLYAYNNTEADTLANNNNQLLVNNDFYSIIDKAESIYVSSRFKASSYYNDSLMYRNFNGEQNLYSQSIPHLGVGANFFKITHSESRVYKLDANGNIDGKLSCVNTLASYEFNMDVSGIQQPNYLFEVGDKLAWVHAYYAVNDTIGQFTYTDSGGNEQQTNIEFPAGQGSIILWLDIDLNILDHWLIPFQNPGIGGININSIMPYQGDTLLIHGNFNPNTTSDLNPFGDTEIFTANEWSSFFAFYSAPEILTGVKKVKKLNSLSVFPNPATYSLSVIGLNDVHDYRIYDLSGRALHKGRVSQSEHIPVSNLTSGMYILHIANDGGGNTAKFVIE